MGHLHDVRWRAVLLLGVTAVLCGEVVTRGQVAEELDLVVAVDRNLNVYLQSRGNHNLRYTLATEPFDCEATVQRIAATDVTILCKPEKGNLYTIRKFVFDPRAKALVGRVDYDVVPFDRIVRTARGATFAGKEPLAVAYDGGTFRVLKATPAEPKPQQPKPLPKSTWDQFAAARPARVKDGYTQEATTFEEYIGPTQKIGKSLWFGKSFYDGEGMSGVGGFGYFDGKYHMFSPPEIAAWSVSAILVEDDAVWLGLAQCGEWATTSGGLLRYDRRTNTSKVIPVSDVISDIERSGDQLLLATDFGIAIVENNTVRRYFVDKLTDGRLRVAEARLGK